MQVPYEKKDAGLDVGYGLFSSETIPSGTLVWKYTAGVNVSIYDGKAAANRLALVPSLEEAQNWLDMTYGLNGLLHEILDDGRFMNHSDTPNCKTRENGDTYTIQDVQAGEQLFEDYTSFGTYFLLSHRVTHDFEPIFQLDHPDFLFDLLEKYDCAPEYYPLPDRDDDVAINSVDSAKVLDGN